MANYVYGAVALVGGGTGALDSIDGGDLNQDDAAIVFTSTGAYIYNLDESSGGTESSPALIAPDNNAGNKRWILISSRGADTSLDVSTFAGILDANDDDVQKALDTIDDLFSTDDFIVGAGSLELKDSVPKSIGTDGTAVIPVSHAFGITGNGRVSTEPDGANVKIKLADLGVVTKTEAYTILAIDDTVIGDCAGGNITLTLPDASTKDIIRIIKKSSSNTLTLACYGSQTIQAETTITMTNEYDSAVLISDGANTWIIGGGSAATATYA